MPGSPRTLSSLLGSAVLSPQCHPATLSLRPRILTAAPAPSCRQKPPAPPLQSGSPSAAWGSKDTKTAGGCWSGTLSSSRQQAVKREQGPRCTQTQVPASTAPQPCKFPSGILSTPRPDGKTHFQALSLCRARCSHQGHGVPGHQSARPRLQRHPYSGKPGTQVAGATWGCWHMPSFGPEGACPRGRAGGRAHSRGRGGCAKWA